MITLITCLLLGKKWDKLAIVGKVLLISMVVLIDLFILTVLGFPVGLLIWLLS